MAEERQLNKSLWREKDVGKLQNPYRPGIGDNGEVQIGQRELRSGEGYSDDSGEN